MSGSFSSARNKAPAPGTLGYGDTKKLLDVRQQTKRTPRDAQTDPKLIELIERLQSYKWDFEAMKRA